MNFKLILVLNLLVLSSIFLSVQAVSAQTECINIQLSKPAYLTGELFQAEITGEFQKPITLEDVSFFKENSEYSPAIGFEQAASNKWIVWMNAPKNPGKNSIKVKALCKDLILREETKSVEFTIQKPIQDIHSKLISTVDGKWSSLSSDEISLALEVLDYNKKLFADGAKELWARSQANECWPKGSCNIKSTSFAVAALYNSTSTSTDKAKNWLLDSENNVEIGLWDLVATSNSVQSCEVNVNGQKKNVNLVQGANSPISLTLADDLEVVVSTNCSLSSAKVSHTYLGNVHYFDLASNNGVLSVALNNRKCWGKGYREQCDATSTANALLALSRLGETSLSSETSWLGQNADTTEERAIYHHFTKDSATEAWIINNQAQDGYWARNALSISQTPDISSTARVLTALPETKDQRTLGENWLKKTLEAENGAIKPSAEETALSLQIFDKRRIEPLVSSTGLIKASSGKNFTVRIYSSGIMSVNLAASTTGRSQSIILQPLFSSEITLEAPQSQEFKFDYLDLSYSTEFGNQGGYKIPMLIIPSSVKEEGFSAFINGTSAEGRYLIPPLDVSFVKKEVNIELGKVANNSFTVTLQNRGDYPRNVSISVSGIYDLLENVEPANFQMLPDANQEVKVLLNTERAFGNYFGRMIADSAGAQDYLSINITIVEKVSAKTCGELNGKFCKAAESCGGEIVTASDGACCLTQCTATKKEGSGLNVKLIGWTMLVLGVLIAAGLVYHKLKKKPQPALKTVLDKIKESQREVLGGEGDIE